MEDRTYQKVIGIIIVIAIFGVAFYGSYLPMRKAEIFITTLQNLQSSPASSLSDLETRLSIPLDYPSPIGQEELVRNMANSVLSFVQQGGDSSSTNQLITYLNSYYNPILSQGKGMSFGQDLYLEGAINEIAFAQTGQPMYLASATQYYLQANQLGPNRPQPLYGLFDVYRAGQDATDTIAVGEKILENWPTDTNVRAAMAQFLNPPTSTKAVVK